ncbi:hypothetical protein ASPBRDRAFT_189757 [Aspergillus brasiliensis CBS 101740]|uniref:Zn(2)-C6 fungal-type domain-containing protein n=1 Tax=Aspergillus brasiliensis (strain CBS 101740 / IMI 381727 / IBT 21946) TaxID=767769 RepID=A0A1L9U253_ASPBC|nr:hypothetical protein ASPBRDRAFT_189757 [Aspergillus brasiliensis CBS 101740]
MPISSRQVKVACLACRAHKTRCDGQSPCASCHQNHRQCVYRPSRRGGARRGAKYENAKKQQQDRQADIGIHHLSPLVDDGVTGPSSDDTVGASCPTSPPHRVPGSSFDARGAIALRAYMTEKDLLNAYYIYIHPYLPLLPPPPFPQTEDRSLEIFPPESPDWSAVPFERRSPLALALSALLVLIPPASDLTPLSEPATSLRASYSQLYIRAADELLQAHARPAEPTWASLFATPASSSWSPLHPQVPADLDCVLAMLALAVHEYCQAGNRKQMRARAYQAITAAMDISLHSLGVDDPSLTLTDAHKRTWWMTMYLVTQSAIFNHAEPIILKDDPRIRMPYPEFRGCREPWPVLMEAQDALRRAGLLARKLAQTCRNGAIPSQAFTDDIRRLDAELVTIGSRLDKSRCITNQDGAETFAARNLWVIAIQFVHTARIKLHRFNAFADKPLFLDKHCDLTTFGLDDLAGCPSTASSPSDNFILNASPALPFTARSSARICLKSALVICRIARTMPAPNARFSELSTAAGTDTAGPLRGSYPRSLPYLACAGMQACYVLLMLVRLVRACVALDDLGGCWGLLDSPEPGTEVQEAERVMEEMRNGIAAVRASLAGDGVFGGVLPMAREVDATYLVYCQGGGCICDEKVSCM